MNKMDLCLALDGIDDELLERSEGANGRSASLKHRIIAAVCAACLAFVFMGAAAINHWDDIQKWVAYCWEYSTGTELGGYQLEAVERLSQDVGVSQTVNGVTVTVDSAALFGNKLEGILCVEGLSIPKKKIANMGYCQVLINGEPCNGTSMSYIDDNGILVIPFSAVGNAASDEKSVTVKVVIDEFVTMETRKILCSGPWELEFEVKYEAADVIELSDTVISAYYEIFPEIIEDLPLKIGESQTVGGITVTVESARVMADSFVLLVKVEGDEIPDSGMVATYGNRMSLTADPAQCEDFTADKTDSASKGKIDYYRFVGYTKGYDYSEPLNLTLSMSDFMAYEGGGGIIAKGDWNISFALMPDRIYEELPLSGEMPITITNIELSDTGLKFEFEYEHGGVWNEKTERMVGEKNVFITNYGDDKVYVVLKDRDTGEEYKIYSSSGSQDGRVRNELDPIQHYTCYFSWPAPINIDEVVEVHIGDAVITVG